MSDGVQRELEECLREIRALKRDIYGDPQTRQKGAFERLDHLEDKLQDLRSTYEREKVGLDHFNTLEARLDQLSLDYRIAIVYLRGIAGAVGTIAVGLLAAIVVSILRAVNGG